MADTSDDLPRTLVTDAVIGRRYLDIPWQGQLWTVVHEQVMQPGFLDIHHTFALSLAIGTLSEGSRLVFRCPAWDQEPYGRPSDFTDATPCWKEYWQPGGVMDCDNPLTMYISSLVTGTVIEFRATGSESTLALDRLLAAWSDLNPQTGRQP